jgi:hypothetical protein
MRLKRAIRLLVAGLGLLLYLGLVLAVLSGLAGYSVTGTAVIAFAMAIIGIPIAWFAWRIREYRDVDEDSTHRRAALADIIGPGAAKALSTCRRWAAAAFVFCLLPTPLSVLVSPGSSALGLGLLLVLFAIGCGCGVRSFLASAQVARLAQGYVSKELGWPVRITAANLSTGSWLRQIEALRRKGPGLTH